MCQKQFGYNKIWLLNDLGQKNNSFKKILGPTEFGAKNNRANKFRSTNSLIQRKLGPNKMKAKKFI